MSTINSINHTKYIIDTNTIAKFAYWLPLAMHSDFWNKMENKLHNGEWVLLDCVVGEIKYFGHELNIWMKKQKNFVTKITQKDFLKAAEINNSYPMIEQSTGRSTVDTYIVAHALNNGLGILSQENSRRLGEKLYKIPDTCSLYNIPCIKRPDTFLKKINY